MVANGVDKSRISKDPHTGIEACIAIRDTKGAICTAVVDDNILPVGVILRKNTLDTFAKIWLAVVNGSHDAYKWLVIHW